MCVFPLQEPSFDFADPQLSRWMARAHFYAMLAAQPGQPPPQLLARWPKVRLGEPTATALRLRDQAIAQLQPPKHVSLCTARLQPPVACP